MYLAARAMEIQPSEFWDMTLGELLLELDHKVSLTPEAQLEKKREQWLKAAEMSDEEWWATNGNS